MQVLCWIFIIDIFLIGLVPIITFAYIVFKFIQKGLAFLEEEYDEEGEDDEDMEA